MEMEPAEARGCPLTNLVRGQQHCCSCLTEIKLATITTRDARLCRVPQALPKANF